MCHAGLLPHFLGTPCLQLNLLHLYLALTSSGEQPWRCMGDVKQVHELTGEAIFVILSVEDGPWKRQSGPSTQDGGHLGNHEAEQRLDDVLRQVPNADRHGVLHALRGSRRS